MRGGSDDVSQSMDSICELPRRRLIDLAAVRRISNQG